MVSGWQNNENCWFMVFCNKSEWGSSVAKYSKPASDNIRKAKLIGDNRAIMTHCRWLIWHVSHRPFIISFFLLLCTIISVSSKVPLTPTYDSLFMAHPAIPRDDLSASSRLLPIHTSSNQPIRELIEWDWHYPIKTHYSTRLVENPKFALNTAPTTRQSCFVKKMDLSKS